MRYLPAPNYLENWQLPHTLTWRAAVAVAPGEPVVWQAEFAAAPPPASARP